MPIFTLVVVTTEDGFIARHPADSPATWASAEEQAHFLGEVERADWSILGRNTHEAANRKERRRIVFSSSAATPHWRCPTQIWLDPAQVSPADLAPMVAGVRPMRNALILGGTRVHDWFDAARAIARVQLTIEPVTFGQGLPVFTGTSGVPEATFAARGYRLTSERRLNDRGTRLLDFTCDDAAVFPDLPAG
jgi:dihydrofolate reductase